MDIQAINTLLAIAPRNSFVSFTYENDLTSYCYKSRSDKNKHIATYFPNGLNKRRKCFVRVGESLAYDNFVINAAIKAGADAELVSSFKGGDLKGWHWLAGHDKLIQVNDKSGEYALRTYPCRDRNGNVVKDKEVSYVDNDGNVLDTALVEEVLYTKGLMRPMSPKSYLVVNNVQILDNMGNPVEKVHPKVYYLNNISNMKVCGMEL